MNSNKYIACTTGMYTNEGETYEKENTHKGHKRVGLKTTSARAGDRLSLVSVGVWEHANSLYVAYSIRTG